MVKPDETWPDLIVGNREFDFGRVSVGSTPSHRFRLTNRTKRQLNLHSVTTSCGCMKALLDADTIPIDASVDLIVMPQTRKLRGKKVASIHVRFDRPAREIKFVTEVHISNFSVEPANLQLFKTEDMTEQRSVVKILNEADKDWEIVKISVSDPSLTAVITKTEGGNLGTRQLDCRFSYNGQTKAASQQQIVVHTSDSREPKILIPVEIKQKTPAIRCTAQPLRFLANDWKQGRMRKLLIVTRNQSEIEEIDVIGGQWQAHELNPAMKKTHVLLVKPDAVSETGVTHNGVLKGKIVVKTSNGLSCEATVSIDLSDQRDADSSLLAVPPDKGQESYSKNPAIKNTFEKGT